jgi:hypothetical protein
MQLRRPLVGLLAAVLASAVVPVVPGLAAPAGAALTSRHDATQWLAGSTAVSRFVAGSVLQDVFRSRVDVQGGASAPLLAPAVGQVFYLHVETAALLWNGSYQMTLKLPAGVTLATPTPDAEASCEISDLSDVETRPSGVGECAAPWLFGGVVTLPTVVLNPGEKAHFWFPVTSSTALTDATVQLIAKMTDTQETSAPNPATSRVPLTVGTATTSYVRYPITDVTAVTNTSAALQGLVVNRSKAGTAWVQYGRTPSYGLTAPAQAVAASLPSVGARLAGPYAVTGLLHGTTYHWRLVFRTTAGTLYYGADRTFMTTGADTTAPSASIKALPAFSILTRIQVSISAADYGAGLLWHEIRYTKTKLTGGASGPWMIPQDQTMTGGRAAITGEPGFRYCFSVRARDLVGNMSAWTAPTAKTCTILPVDDTALVTSTGWTRGSGTGPGWFRSTSTTALLSGIQLRRDNLGTYQVGVIATACPTCGALTVYVGATKVGTLSLVSPTLVKRKLVLLPRFSTKRSGTIRLVVTSPVGRLVKVDALATTAW